MKKWIVLAVASFIMMNVHAKESWCGYKDYFRLSDSTHPDIYIVNGFSDQDVVLQIVSPRSFIISDSEQCRSGYAHITVAYDLANWCVLDIQDGPYINHPKVTAACRGIRYIDTKHDNFGGHAYTIELD
jgi:hypothetical protein